MPCSSARRGRDTGRTPEKTLAGRYLVDFDRGLNTAINRLREALGDNADNPRFVETMPQRGYRFIAPVETRAALNFLLELRPSAFRLTSRRRHARRCLLASQVGCSPCRFRHWATAFCAPIRGD